ncbi:hypothetical protein PAXRUDRAFT_823215 [Paxillus rubicundulus Ve08.2h10]|uniref:Ribosome biogenesis protein SLX9 n=1 Tax=Paxillus rubicundulus Ve08.2h10 TaxID=930991 RepID=A0A0D0DVQ8_9AGAM|nr:hypothetical protein PAXRUDRAFT_823215 [Paxillus rubicundulus Ve08.2h10]
MPRERRARIGAHQPSAKLAKRQFAVQENAVEGVEVGAAAEVSGQEILDSLNEAPLVVGKKVKQQLKHEAFINGLKSPITPYSKAQRRRFNRKQREQVGGGLGSIQAVISALEEKEPSPGLERAQQPKDHTQPQPTKAKAKAGMGAGKGVPLTKSQRKRALEVERLRHPLILSNPQFAANPFQTIRTHAQNTLERHVPSV